MSEWQYDCPEALRCAYGTRVVLGACEACVSSYLTVYDPPGSTPRTQSLTCEWVPYSDLERALRDAAQAVAAYVSERLQERVT